MNGWQLLRDIPLRPRNTFGVDVQAPLLLEVAAAEALPAALDALDGVMPLAIGEGSNLLFAGTPEQPLLHVRGNGIAVLDDDGDAVRVRAEAGVHWHALVEWSLAAGLCGLENLALIPGSVGAAPIQNIGAYGVELAEHLHAVHGYDIAARRWRRFDRAACAFGYRDSVFKHAAAEVVVTAVELQLHRHAAPVLGYAGIGAELDARGIARPTARDVADAVIALRRRKLPDPAVLGNAGSFFRNPIVAAATAERLQATHPGLPTYPAGDGLRKLSAAWLIEQAGFKGARAGDAGISAGHALVLVNHGHASGADLLAFACAVATGVRAHFGVTLEPEPRLVGATW